MRAVVALQADHRLHAEFLLEAHQVARERPAKAVDRLVVVAHAKEEGPGFARDRIGGEALQPAVLQRVRVLEFVDQHVPEARAVMRPQRLVAREQLVAAQEQLGEIHHPLALALRLVLLPQRQKPLGAARLGRHLVRAQPLLLVRVDEGKQLAWRRRLLGDIEPLEQALDGRELVGRIQDLEHLRQARGLVMDAQQAVRQRMEGPHPHAAQARAQRFGQEPRQARGHLARRLVGEGHRHDLVRPRLARLQQPGDAAREHPRFSRASTGQDEGVLRRQGHRRALFWIESLQDLVHRASSGSVPAFSPGPDCNLPRRRTAAGNFCCIATSDKASRRKTRLKFGRPWMQDVARVQQKVSRTCIFPPGSR